jgi:hypothetical protein
MLIFSSKMPKSTIAYWNPLDATALKAWQPIPQVKGVEELTLSQDPETGE